MTNTIKIDIKRTGFPVTIGGVELWLDTSPENLARLTKSQKEVDKRLKKIKEKAKRINLPDVTIRKELENISPEQVDVALELHTEFIAAQYDVIFGDGTFKKLYEKHPNVEALESALNEVAPILAKEIEGVTVRSTL